MPTLTAQQHIIERCEAHAANLETSTDTTNSWDISLDATVTIDLPAIITDETVYDAALEAAGGEEFLNEWTLTDHGIVINCCYVYTYYDEDESISEWDALRLALEEAADWCPGVPVEAWTWPY